MRVALINASARRKDVPAMTASLAKGMEAMGHRVDVLDAWTEEGTRLPGYEYIVVAAQSVSLFGGKMPACLAKLLSGASSLVGKKSAAFIVKTGPFTSKALSNLMRGMEKEGMFVNWSDILLNPGHAEAVGKRIGA